MADPRITGRQKALARLLALERVIASPGSPDGEREAARGRVSVLMARWEFSSSEMRTARLTQEQSAARRRASPPPPRAQPHSTQRPFFGSGPFTSSGTFNESAGGWVRVDVSDFVFQEYMRGFTGAQDPAQQGIADARTELGAARVAAAQAEQDLVNARERATRVAARLKAARENMARLSGRADWPE